MSFVWKRPEGRLKSPELCAAETLEVALSMGLDEFAAVLAVMAEAQESDFWCPWNAKDETSHNYPFDSESNDGRSVAYLQQQNKRAGEVPAPANDWWGPMADRMDLKRSLRRFFERLEPNYHEAINDPMMASTRFISNVQRCRPDLRGEYAKHWDRAWALVRGAVSGQKPPPKGPDVTWRGDPVWLEEVLRPALGDRLKTLEGWQDSGHGDYKDIRGVMVHHTGASNASAQSIRDGRPDLKGPLSNLHIAPDGTVTIVAVGVCWHAGFGSYPWLPTNEANWHMIGIECAWPPWVNGSPNKAALWPDAQILSMRDTCAALALKLGHPATRVIGHKEYAGSAQGKWDPGNMDMPWFRGEVAKDMRGEFDKPVKPPPVQPDPVPPPILPPPVNIRTDRVLLQEVWDQLRGPGGHGWEQLDGKTVVDKLAEMDRKLDAIVLLINKMKKGGAA